MFATSTADFSQLRLETMQAHEIAALFETVADIAGVSEDDDAAEATNEDGQSVNAYGSPLSLWELKTGLLTPTPPGARSLWSRIKWGVCQAAIDEMGAESRRPEGVAVAQDATRMSSRVDMEITFDAGSSWEPLLAKNVAGSSIDMWRNAVGDWVVPESVLLEAQHHMSVRGASNVHVAALFSGVTIRRFVIERDDDIIGEIRDAATRFWECVESKRRPSANGKRDQKVICRLNAIIDPDRPVNDLRGDANVQRLLAEKERLKAEEKKAKSQVEEIDEKLRAMMDGYASAIVSDTSQLRWIVTPAKEVSYTTSASAYLRVTKIGKKSAGTPIQGLIEGA